MKRRPRSQLPFVALIATLGCGLGVIDIQHPEDTPSADNGSPNGSSGSTLPADGGTLLEKGLADAGKIAGERGGEVDAGSVVDAGDAESDAGLPLDAGTDAGTEPDADAGTEADAGNEFIGTPVPGEGRACQTGSTSACGETQTCASDSAYQSPTGVCRTECSAGCSSGESCGSDSTCQCSPGLTKSTPGDPCAPAGLICHPDFHVCLPELPAGTDCPTGQIYSPAWTLCVL